MLGSAVSSQILKLTKDLAITGAKLSWHFSLSLVFPFGPPVSALLVLKKSMSNKKVPMHLISILTLTFALVACSGVTGGGGSADPVGGFSHAVGDVASIQGGAAGATGSGAGGGSGDNSDLGGGSGTEPQSTGDGAGGQPSQGTIPGPKRGSFNVKVMWPHKGQIEGFDVAEMSSEQQRQRKMQAAFSADKLGEASLEMTLSPFPEAKPFVNLWLVNDMNQGASAALPSAPYTSEPTDEWGEMIMGYPVGPKVHGHCPDVLDVWACFSDGTRFFQSERIRLYCPQDQGKPPLITLTLYPSSVPLDCRAQGLGTIDMSASMGD